MNERMARASPQVIAEYVTAFEETPSAENANVGGARPLIADVQRRAAALLGAARAPAKAGAAANSDPVVWIVWRDEKGPTLWDLMQPVRSCPPAARCEADRGCIRLAAFCRTPAFRIMVETPRQLVGPPSLLMTTTPAAQPPWIRPQKKNVGDFPYNLEPYLLGRELRLPRGAKRRQVGAARRPRPAAKGSPLE
jgi:hypothetical protein